MTSVFPFRFKIAKVVLVFNKDLNLDYSNYRPISLLSNSEIMLEKLMYEWLYTLLSKNSVIYNLQFGFWQQYFTFHALINVTENIRKALDDGNMGCPVLEDIHKVFDTVYQQILLAKLITMGFVEFKMIGLNPLCLIAISIYL